MKILHLNTYDITGGAARAAYRLYKGLLSLGRDCNVLVRDKASVDDSVFAVATQSGPDQSEGVFFLETVIQQCYAKHNRTHISNTLFSIPYFGWDVSDLPLVRAADILNLHWINGLLPLFSLKKLFSLGKPVVWTLHDQWAFTGGCHYSAGCEKYCEKCSDCPQLADDPFGLTKMVLKDKMAVFKDAPLCIVTPSRWMKDCVQKSRLLTNMRTEVIPNGLETDIFKPYPKRKAKEKFGILPETLTLLFGAEYVNEKRKGFDAFMAAMRHCLETPDFKSLAEAGRIKIMCFGHPGEELETLNIQVVPLGYLPSDQEIRDAYCAADIFIQSSLEDNLPNTVLEAMSCGTPVAAFSAGGIPDMVKEGISGKLAPVGDSRALGEAVISLVFKPEALKTMGRMCRKAALEKYALDIQARSYAALYDELNKRLNKTVKTASDHSISKSRKDSQDSGALSAPFVAEPDAHFRQVYDQVLLKALKWYSLKRETEFRSLMTLSDDWKNQINVLNHRADERLEKINILTARLKASEDDRRQKDGDIETLWHQLKELEQDRRDRDLEMDRMAGQLKNLAADADERLEKINILTARLKASEDDRRRIGRHMEALWRQLEDAEKDRQARGQEIERLAARIAASEADGAERLEKINILNKQLQESDEDRVNLAESVEKISGKLQQTLQENERILNQWAVRCLRRMGIVNRN